MGLEEVVLESQFQCNIGGRDLVIKTGKLAGQADAAVTVTYGETIVLVTVCFSPDAREGVDFLPFTVDYEERLYAAGKIPGGFIRREGRPSEAATLACRLIDRPIRPLLPKTWRKEIQLIVTVLSADQENDPDILALVGASSVLSLSAIPFDGPIGAIRVGYIDGEMVVNPTLGQMAQSQLDLVVASSREKVVMVEAGAKEVSEDIMLEAIKFAHEANQEIIRVQEELRNALGKAKVEFSAPEKNKELITAVSQIIDEKLDQALSLADRTQREEMLSVVRKEAISNLNGTYTESEIKNAYEDRLKKVIRSRVLDKMQRIGGRGITEIRPISCEVGLLPRTHGSALFTRGQTQVLAIATLGSTRQEQMLDGLGIEESKRFIHHYNFPPFSSGEVRRTGTPGRREIGHGALAERALLPMVPDEVEFPYTIRLVSEVLSSNGSTSMASTCAGSLSLMDAGIPTRKPVAGIAMGLITDEDGRFVVLTDLEGLEDFNGDMDFKIAGTSDGITAVQMDTKLKGLTMEIIEKTLSQGKEARMTVLGKMNAALSTPRPEVSQYAPRMQKIKIDQSKIGAVIGSGGKTIRSIIEQTKTTIDVGDDGTIIIGSPDVEASRRAIEIIEGLTKDVEVGEVYTGKVSRILDFGAMVEILPGKEGMVHISELADYRVGKVEDVVKIGDEVMVKVINIDHMGRINLSRRALFEKESKPGEDGSPTPDYPFRSSRSSSGGYPPRGGQRRPGGFRPRDDRRS
jgi:polyribonucleotide nucleotidyltransferase